MSETKSRKNPVTSLLADRSVTKEDREIIHQKLIKALQQIKVGGISEEIAVAAGVTYAQTHKRLPELRDRAEPIVYNPGLTKPGSAGRACMIWQLVALQH